MDRDYGPGVCKIAKHGGKIWAESDEKSVTDFIIELPIA